MSTNKFRLNEYVCISCLCLCILLFHFCWAWALYYLLAIPLPISPNLLHCLSVRFAFSADMFVWMYKSTILECSTCVRRITKPIHSLYTVAPLASSHTWNAKKKKKKMKWKEKIVLSRFEISNVEKAAKRETNKNMKKTQNNGQNEKWFVRQNIADREKHAPRREVHWIGCWAKASPLTGLKMNGLWPLATGCWQPDNAIRLGFYIIQC